MRRTIIAPGEHYHIFNRGNEKQKLFHDERDWTRFLFLVLHLQSTKKTHNVSSYVKKFIKTGEFGMTDKNKKKLLESRDVKLSLFTLMPNHFHLLVSEFDEGGISRYVHVVSTAYAMYFNIKYRHSGHVFQGTFGATHIESNEQLLHLSAYMHRNPRELSMWKRREDKYPWSSYQDCVHKNRWGEFLDTSIITGQFKNGTDYKKFVESSGAKELRGIEREIDIF